MQDDVARQAALAKMAGWMEFYSISPDTIPDHPDLYRIIELIMAKDAWAKDLGKVNADEATLAVNESLEGLVDHDTLMTVSLWRAFDYLAHQLMSGDKNWDKITQILDDMEVRPQELMTNLSAIWMAGFITGASFSEGRATTENRLGS